MREGIMSTCSCHQFFCACGLIERLECVLCRVISLDVILGGSKDFPVITVIEETNLGSCLSEVKSNIQDIRIQILA